MKYLITKNGNALLAVNLIRIFKHDIYDFDVRRYSIIAEDVRGQHHILCNNLNEEEQKERMEELLEIIKSKGD